MFFWISSMPRFQIVTILPTSCQSRSSASLAERRFEPTLLRKENPTTMVILPIFRRRVCAKEFEDFFMVFFTIMVPVIAGRAIDLKIDRPAV
jgi:hypothetical protein